MAVSAEDIVDMTTLSDVKISPAGDQVLYVATPYACKGDHPVSSIWLAKYGKEHSARQLTSGLFHDTQPQWAPDGESIAFVSDRSKPGESSAIFVLSLKMGEPHAVTPVDNKKAISALLWSPDSNFISYLSPDEDSAEKQKREKDKNDAKIYGAEWDLNRIRLVHVTSRTVSVLYGGNWHAYSHAWSRDSKQMVYSLHEDPIADTPVLTGVRFEIITIATGKSELIYSHPSITEGNPVGWGPDGIYFLAGVTHHMNSSVALYRIDLKSKEATRVAHGVENQAERFKANKNFVCVQVLEGLKDELRIHEGSSLYSGTKELESWDVAMDDTGGSFATAIVFSDAATPYELYSIEPKTKAIVQLSNHNANITAAHLGTAHEVACRSYDDKVQLEGHFIKPGTSSDSPASPLPTFVMVHGGPSFRQTQSFIAPHYPWMPYVLAGGKYGVLTVNYRGNYGYGEEHAAQVRGHAGTLEHDDVLALVDEGIKQGFIDATRIIIGGWSYGGLLSFLATARNGRTFAGNEKNWRYKGAIPGAGVCDWDSMALTSDLGSFFQQEMSGVSPWTASSIDDTSGRRGSALWELGRVTPVEDVPPVLVLHGENDVRVPVSQAWAFQRACKHWKVPCEMATYPRGGHMIGERAHLIDMLIRVRKFADLHLS